MSSYVKFTALSGAKNQDPLSYLLEIDELKILLDCGWYDSFNVDDLALLKRFAKQVDVVLFSHADLEHLGAYPYAYSKLGLQCPAYTTIPIQNLGMTCLKDAVMSKQNEELFEVFTVEDVDQAFSKVVGLRYSQPFSLTGKCHGVVITAYPAGHTVGGAIWKIQKDTEDIVYAVDYNHKKERHLNGAALGQSGTVIEHLTRPTLLITDSYNSLSTQFSRKIRDSAVFETLMGTLQGGGNALLPIDASTRILEIAYFLDQLWSFHRISFPLVILSNQSHRTIQWAKSILEWMGDAVANAFSQQRENPFHFKHIKLCHSLQELEKLSSPKVVLATSLSLDCGFARHLFLNWCQNPKNTVILSQKGPPNSLARKLYQEWLQKVSSYPGSAMKPAINMQSSFVLNVKQKIPLEGIELREYIQKENERKSKEAAEAALLAKNKSIMEDSDSGSEDDEHDVEQLLNTQYDLYVKDAARSGGFFKQSQSYRMFPYFEKKKKFDDYGEIIQPELYMKDEQQPPVTTTPEQTEADLIKNEAELKAPEVPSKFIANEQNIKVACKMIYIDLEGLSDGRSIKNILPHVGPRKLIIIHGDEESTEDLHQSCLAYKGMTNEIFTPTVGECTNVSSATNFYQVKLTDALVSSIKMSKLDEYELGFINGMVKITSDSTIPVLDNLTSNLQKAHTPVIVGDLKLTEFKKLLLSEGFEAEFVSGGLVCSGNVVVRKTTHGQLLLDGDVSEEYFKIRELLYKQHTVL